jgi:hypothetical protein
VIPGSGTHTSPAEWSCHGSGADAHTGAAEKGFDYGLEGDLEVGLDSEWEFVYQIMKLNP